jgi:hypothetical protein
MLIREIQLVRSKAYDCYKNFTSKFRSYLTVYLYLSFSTAQVQTLKIK